ncbi:Rho guanyl-nucleotide exchange factor activity, variant 5 [Bonamia ostreae]|uniref:Rho guanyl-nucleotide exchange factor activity, variant 5 n=1 Tax=Bonamia ostreae TaxID=126728 RepID=A0ABV2AJR8_9EUKA
MSANIISLKSELMNEIKGTTHFRFSRTGSLPKNEKYHTLKSAIVLPETFRELIRTEENYIKSLENLNNLRIVLKKTGLRQQRLFKENTNENRKIIFRNIKSILKLSNKFLSELKDIVIDKHFFVNLSLIFSKFAPYMKEYAIYGMGQLEASEMLNKIDKKDKTFIEFCDCWLKNIEEATFDGLLILPIQRIPRYFLLLQKMSKYVYSKRDIKLIEKAMNSIQIIISHIDKSILFKERERISIKIQNMFPKESLLSASRRYVKMDIVVLKTELKKKKFIGRNVLLVQFNDLLMVGLKKQKKYKKIWDCDTNKLMVSKSSKSDLDINIWSDHLSFIVKFPFVAKRDEWIDSLKKQPNLNKNAIKIHSIMLKCVVCGVKTKHFPCCFCNFAHCKVCSKNPKMCLECTKVPENAQVCVF